MFQSCKFLPAKYMGSVEHATEGTDITLASTKAFYVMMAGAFQNTVTGTIDASTGFVSPNFVPGASGADPVDGTKTNIAYVGANFATYHKFTYVGAYVSSSTTRMTTFRGRGGMGSAAT